MKKLLVVLALTSAMGAQTLPENPKPKFFNKVSTIEMTVVASTLAMDGFTTMHRPSYYSEANPIARPFVKSSYGSAVYFGASFAAALGGNYILRNHSKARHIFNWSIVGLEIFASTSNFKTD